jgi:hypothetical protein
VGTTRVRIDETRARRVVFGGFTGKIALALWLGVIAAGASFLALGHIRDDQANALITMAVFAVVLTVTAPRR